jgi:aquaporin Z
VRPPPVDPHLPDYLAEYAGTAFLLLVGLTAVAWDFGAGSPVARHIASAPVRRLITGTIFAGAGTLVVLSPLGRRSGGHLNPAVSLAFHRLGKMRTRDLIGYIAAQVLGAVTGALIVRLLWGRRALSTHLGATQPGSLGVWMALVAEVLCTFALMTLILEFIDRPRLMRYTAYAAGGLVALFVVVEAPVSGTSLNPARSLGPAVLAPLYSSLWLYLIAPPVGAVAAALLFRRRKGRATPCAKLLHDDRHPCLFIDCAYGAPDPAELAPKGAG